MKISNLAKKASFIGSFTVSKTKIRFHPELRYSEYIKFGNMVYFMFVKNRLMKIGIAGGQRGWVSRSETYKLGKRGDRTNHRIIRIMNDLGESTIDVYAVKCPKQKITFTCPLTGVIIEDEVEVTRLVEQRLTKQYLSESVDNELPFSNQLR